MQVPSVQSVLTTRDLSGTFVNYFRAAVTLMEVSGKLLVFCGDVVFFFLVSFVSKLV